LKEVRATVSQGVVPVVFGCVHGKALVETRPAA
jgi:hypothetical protein